MGARAEQQQRSSRGSGSAAPLTKEDNAPAQLKVNHAKGDSPQNIIHVNSKHALARRMRMLVGHGRVLVILNSERIRLSAIIRVA